MLLYASLKMNTATFPFLTRWALMCPAHAECALRRCRLISNQNEGVGVFIFRILHYPYLSTIDYVISMALRF